MAITQAPREPSMGACQGARDLDHSLRTARLVHTAKAREAKRDRDTQAHTFTQKMDL